VPPLIEVGVGRERRDGLIVDRVLLGRDLDDGFHQPVAVPPDVREIPGGLCPLVQSTSDDVCCLLRR
jgi:hypothetical protein